MNANMITIGVTASKGVNVGLTGEKGRCSADFFRGLLVGAMNRGVNIEDAQGESLAGLAVQLSSGFSQAPAETICVGVTHEEPKSTQSDVIEETDEKKSALDELGLIIDELMLMIRDSAGVPVKPVMDDVDVSDNELLTQTVELGEPAGNVKEDFLNMLREMRERIAGAESTDSVPEIFGELKDILRGMGDQLPPELEKNIEAIKDKLRELFVDNVPPVDVEPSVRLDSSKVTEQSDRSLEQSGRPLQEGKPSGNGDIKKLEKPASSRDVTSASTGSEQRRKAPREVVRFEQPSVEAKIENTKVVPVDESLQEREQKIASPIDGIISTINSKKERISAEELAPSTDSISIGTGNTEIKPNGTVDPNRISVKSELTAVTFLEEKRGQQSGKDMWSRNDSANQQFQSRMENDRGTPKIVSNNFRSFFDAKWQPTTVMQELTGVLKTMVSNQRQQAVMRLYPPELGKVDVNINFQNGDMVVKLTCETQAVQQLFQENIPQLQKNLTGSGLNQGNVFVESGLLGDKNDQREQDQGNNGRSGKRGLRDEDIPENTWDVSMMIKMSEGVNLVA